MTAGNEEQEPLISTSAEHQRVTYNASPQVSFILLIIKYIENILFYFEKIWTEELSEYFRVWK